MSELRSVEAGKDGLVKDSFSLAVMDRFQVVNLYTRVHVLIQQIDFSHSFGQDRWEPGGKASVKAIGQMLVYQLTSFSSLCTSLLKEAGVRGFGMLTKQTRKRGAKAGGQQVDRATGLFARQAFLFEQAQEQLSQHRAKLNQWAICYSSKPCSQKVRRHEKVVYLLAAFKSLAAVPKLSCGRTRCEQGAKEQIRLFTYFCTSVRR